MWKCKGKKIDAIIANPLKTSNFAALKKTHFHDQNNEQYILLSCMQFPAADRLQANA
jgi:hypothetical protein